MIVLFCVLALLLDDNSSSVAVLARRDCETRYAHECTLKLHPFGLFGRSPKV